MDYVQVHYRYSRRVLWLKAGQSNNNPKIIAYYFLKYITMVKGIKQVHDDCN